MRIGGLLGEGAPGNGRGRAIHVFALQQALRDDGDAARLIHIGSQEETPFRRYSESV